MALPDLLKVQSATPKVFKSSAGDAAITLASLANNASRQSVKLDLGSPRAEFYDVFLDIELAATPTAGNTIDCFWGPSSSATAGTDNPGNMSGADAAYTGYSSNADASNPQLQYIGALTVTAQATATVQKGYVGRFSPAQRYGSLMIRNGAGSAVHSSDANCQVRLVPLEGVVEE